MKRNNKCYWYVKTIHWPSTGKSAKYLNPNIFHNLSTPLQNLVEKLEFNVGRINKILSKRNVNQWKSWENFLQYPPVPVRHIFEVFTILGLLLKTHTHADFLWHVVPVCHDFKTSMHTSKRGQINFTFLFIQFRVR